MRISLEVAGKLLAAATDAMVVVAADGRIVLANPQAERLFGYSRSELVGESIELLLPESERERHKRYRESYHGAPHARPLVSGLPLRGRRKDGTVFSAEIALTPIREDGEPLVASTIRDRNTQGTSDANFRQFLKTAPDAMIVVDQDGRIAIANNQAEDIFGYPHDQLLGKPVELLLPESVRNRHEAHRAGYVQAPKLRPMGIGMDLFARRADGTEFPVEISLSPVESGGQVFVSSVIRDVTERKRMEADLIEARQAAELAHKANTAFLAAASHDLRQPVQALTLLNGALRRTVSDDLAREMVDSQQQSLDAMTNLLNSLLDISRLDAGAIEPDFEEFPARRLIDRLTAEFTRQARQKELTFAAEPNGTVIRSDPNLLTEIIQNLVSNAIRYTEKGQVALTLRQVGDRLSVDVRDTGVGIPAGQLDEIFQEFHQLKAPGRKTEGFGLGLAIVRRLADLLGHEVVVTSEVGQGSCFSVLVPIAERNSRGSAERRPAAGKAPAGSGGEILLIEDDHRVAGAWALLLRAEGYVVHVAESAATALAVVRELAARPDLIISDYHLPGNVNGVEAVDRVRRHFGAELPAFIISGDTSKVVDDARRLENCLLKSKPVHTDDLLTLADEAIRTGYAPNS